MKIVRFKGGLGNQLFQYHFYLAIQKKYPKEEVKADLSFYLKNDPSRPFMLQPLLGDKQLDIATRKDVEALADERKAPFAILRRKLWGGKKSHYIEKGIFFDKTVFAIRQSVLYDGYWQSYKYFENEIETISTKPLYDLLSPNAKAIAEQIKQNNSVGIHVRRGDYYSNKGAKKLLGDICTLKYFKKAAHICQQRLGDCIFYVFSDDPQWVSNNFNINYPYIILPLQSAYDDFFLLSSCTHTIISNSTFSWWAAYLNSNKNSITISPSKWFNDNTIPYEIQDIVPSNWLKI